MDFEERKPNSSQASSAKDDEMVNSEVVRLRQILPEEIWLLVAKELEKRSSENVRKLANSSGFFQNLLAPQRTTYLFEKVFTIVATSVWNKEGLEGLPVSDVLKCRGVSKHWNLVIDKLIPDNFQNFGEGSDANQVDVGAAFTSILRNDFYNWTLEADRVVGGAPNEKRRTEAFLRHFEITHPIYQSKGRSPWLRGNVTVSIYPEDDEDVRDYHGFLQGLTSVLSKYGGHLHTFILDIRKNHFFENPSLLQKWFSEMPNLKGFTFQKYPSGDDDDVQVEDLNLENAVKNCPFPTLKFLEILIIVNLPLPMFNQLIRQNSHVTILWIRYTDQNDYDIFTFPIPNLKSLEINGIPVDIPEKLGSSEVQWPLKYLKLVFNEPFRCAVLLQVIQNKFSNTLVKLSFEIGKVIEQGDALWLDCKNCRLDLPKLKKICVNFMRFPVCLDFLLPMRNNLEKISASFGYGHLRASGICGEGGAIVQFYGFERKMLESNVWAIFKKLKKMEVICNRMDGHKQESLHYSRDDWMMNNLYD